MKRLALLGLTGVLMPLVAGCPIYDDDDQLSCNPAVQNCSGGLGGAGAQGCTKPSDCAANETCGSDNQCHPGNCTFWGCPDGYDCTVGDDLTAACTPAGSGGSGTGGTGGVDNNVYCGNPDDCGEGETCGPDGTCQPGDCTMVGCIYGFACNPDTQECDPQNPAACGEDSDCASFGVGYKCVSGLCTAPADQCFDQTQCGAGKVCAEGKCIDSCNDNGDCEPAYTCDVPHEICSEPAKPCTITNDCGGPDEVCVDGACVPRSDMGSCDPGFVWVENGCTPNQSATFFCNTEGTQDACAAGSICLHHNCYISCAPPNDNACAALPSFDVCKSVTTTTGSYDVCGSNENLGGECDPVSGLDCSLGTICIDGFCK
jgi:hypothetical protein